MTVSCPFGVVGCWSRSYGRPLLVFLLWFVCPSAAGFFCYGFGVRLVLLAAGSAVVADKCWFFCYGLAVPRLGLPLGSILAVFWWFRCGSKLYDSSCMMLLQLLFRPLSLFAVYTIIKNRKLFSETREMLFFNSA